MDAAWLPEPPPGAVRLHISFYRVHEIHTLILSNGKCVAILVCHGLTSRHTGGASEAAAWANASAGGVTIAVAKNQPKPSVSAAQWQGARRCITVAVPTHPTGALSGAHNQPHEVPGLLAKAYTGAIALAAQHDLGRVAFPALGCGGGRHVYPPDAAARLAIKCCVLGALTAEVCTIAFFLGNQPAVARAWIAAVENELAAGTLAEVLPPAPEEDRAPGWRFRLAERRQREAEEASRAAQTVDPVRLPPEPEPEPTANALDHVQNEHLFVQSDDEAARSEEEMRPARADEEAKDDEGEGEAFVAASPLVATIQPSTNTSPSLSEDSEGNVAFRARLRALAEDPAQVELALMERRYYDSWRVLRESPDLTVSFAFVPSDPDFFPRFRDRMTTLLSGSANQWQKRPIGLKLELTLPHDYPSTAVRVAVSTPIPTTHRNAIASLAHDFLTSSKLQLAQAGQTPQSELRRPRLRAMIRHLDRHISAAWDEAEEQAGIPKVKIAWTDAPVEGGTAGVGQISDMANDDTDEMDVELWEPARHAAFQVRHPLNTSEPV